MRQVPVRMKTPPASGVESSQMNVTIPDSLREFVEQQVNARGYADADAFLADLVRAEAQILERVNHGEPLPVDERFIPRLEALLDEAEASGDAVEMTSQDWDEIRARGLAVLRSRQAS